MTVEARILSKGIYAKAGEETCCENGHALARLLRDVNVGQPAMTTDLELLNGMEATATACPICGGKVMAGPGIYYFKA